MLDVWPLCFIRTLYFMMWSWSLLFSLGKMSELIWYSLFVWYWNFDWWISFFQAFFFNSLNHSPRILTLSTCCIRFRCCYGYRRLRCVQTGGWYDSVGWQFCLHCYWGWRRWDKHKFVESASFKLVINVPNAEICPRFMGKTLESIHRIIKGYC